MFSKLVEVLIPSLNHSYKCASHGDKFARVGHRRCSDDHRSFADVLTIVCGGHGWGGVWTFENSKLNHT